MCSLDDQNKKCAVYNALVALKLANHKLMKLRDLVLDYSVDYAEFIRAAKTETSMVGQAKRLAKV
ncbi:hypothetical protein KBG31_00600 [Patescibacteria group bacterium]|nr:hypothetical protein [Patescibacteria group bacterium]